MEYEKENEIDEDVVYALAGATNCNLQREKQKGEVTMCTFFENMKEEGRREGIEIGMEHGIEIGIIDATLKMFAKNMTIEETADILEKDISFIHRIYDIKAAHPAYGATEICEAIQKTKATKLEVM